MYNNLAQFKFEVDSVRIFGIVAILLVRRFEFIFWLGNNPRFIFGIVVVLVGSLK